MYKELVIEQKPQENSYFWSHFGGNLCGKNPKGEKNPIPY